MIADDIIVWRGEAGTGQRALRAVDNRRMTDRCSGRSLRGPGDRRRVRAQLR
jgi:hypothetical protein